MATDATGTPTALGIPKYDTSVDAPSGLGFNAAMDTLDTLIAAAGKTTVKHAGTTVGTRTSVNFIDGANVTLTVADNSGSDRVDVTVAAASPTTDPSMGGDLSGTASNAQIVANAVGTTEIATDAVTAAKIAADAVGSSEIAAGAVGQSELALKYDSGRLVAVTGGGTAITFATAFTAAPKVVITMDDATDDTSQNGGSGAPANGTASVRTSSITTTGCTAYHSQGGTRNLSWHAIGV